MSQEKFLMVEDHGPFKKGQVVYPIKGHDYGVASDDTRYTGVAHSSLTADPNGDYPSHTVPVTKFVALDEAKKDTSMAQYQAKITGKKYAGIVDGYGILMEGKDLILVGMIRYSSVGIRSSPISIYEGAEGWVETENSIYALGAPLKR